MSIYSEGDMMKEPLSGTKWVGKGKGATAKQLLIASDPLAIDQGEVLMAILRKTCDGKAWDHKTNLALTGEPLTDEDLRRIAECE